MTTSFSQVAIEPVRGSVEALDREFLAARDGIVRICRAIVGDDAEDVVHDAYIQARSRIGQLRDVNHAGAWITKIALNMCFERHRRRQRLLQLLPTIHRSTSPSNPDLRTAIEELPLVQKTIVILFYGHGLDLAEISTLLDRKPATVRSLLFRARGRLRKLMEDTTL